MRSDFIDSLGRRREFVVIKWEAVHLSEQRGIWMTSLSQLSLLLLCSEWSRWAMLSPSQHLSAVLSKIVTHSLEYCKLERRQYNLDLLLLRYPLWAKFLIYFHQTTCDSHNKKQRSYWYWLNPIIYQTWHELWSPGYVLSTWSDNITYTSVQQNRNVGRYMEGYINIHV